MLSPSIWPLWSALEALIYSVIRYRLTAWNRVGLRFTITIRLTPPIQPLAYANNLSFLSLALSIRFQRYYFGNFVWPNTVELFDPARFHRHKTIWYADAPSFDHYLKNIRDMITHRIMVWKRRYALSQSGVYPCLFKRRWAKGWIWCRWFWNGLHAFWREYVDGWGGLETKVVVCSLLLL